MRAPSQSVRLIFLIVVGAATIATVYGYRRLRPGRPVLTLEDSLQIRGQYEVIDNYPPEYQPPDWMRQLQLAKMYAAGQRKLEGDSARIDQDLVDSIAKADGAGTYIHALLAEDNGKFFRWSGRHDPIRVWIQSPASEAIGAGFRAWNAANAGVTYEVIDDSTQADVWVTWTPSLPGKWGNTLFQADDAGRLVFARILILSTLDFARQQRTAIHEAGHALGLEHSPDMDDIMFAGETPRTSLVTDADMRTLRLLYQLPFSHY